MMTTGTLMTLAYVVLLWHTLNGNGNKFLVKIEILLLASQIGLVCYGYGFFKVNA